MHEFDYRFGKLRYGWDSRIRLARDCRISRSASLSARYGGAISIGNRTQVMAGALLWTYGGDIVIGDDCSINPYTVAYGHGGLTIGNGVRIAAQCALIPANHRFADRATPIRDQGLDCKGITIEDDVWIGAGVKVLDGVRVARGCVIAAGAVVSKSTEQFGIYGGVPARLIGIRGENDGAPPATEKRTR